VNGRVVQLPELEQTILGAFRRTLPRDRHPVCFLHLHLPPEQIDWNRHPAKAEIYLKELDRLQAQVLEAIAHALSLHAHSLSDAAHSQRLGRVLRAAESGGGYTLGSLDEPNQPIGEDSREESSEEPSAPAFPPSSAPTPLRAIAQVHNMYILAEHPAGIWLIEQHIAHERVLYEELCDRWIVVPLDPPALLPNLSTAQVEQLVRIGLTVEPFGDALWAIRTAPAPLAQREDCAAALLELSLGGDLETALVATACRTAIRNGTPLSLPELQTLLDRWQQTRNPRTCPHGRPICLSLQESSLSRFFRRHWVIGKSHGI
jgi:DNA mismatch repair protein MutL